MKTFTRRQLMVGALIGAGLAMVPLQSALAQAKVPDLVKIVVGFPPGSTPDVLARRVAQSLAPSYSKVVIVENRAGAGGQMAVSATKTAAADGATILLTPMSVLGVYPHTYRNLPYNAETDLTPVSVGVKFDAAFVVGPAVPAEIKTIPQFMQWARANPAKATFGSPASGSTLHFMGVELSRLSQTELTHVAYRGTVAAIPDLLGAQLPSMVSPLGEFLKYAPEGKIRILGTSGEKRSPFTPEVPTFAEQGFKELAVQEMYGFYLPAKVPAAVVQQLNTALGQALVQPQVKEALDTVGMEAAPSTPEELTVVLRDISSRWGPVVQAIGFKAD